jgi:hypothetical protein
MRDRSSRILAAGLFVLACATCAAVESETGSLSQALTGSGGSGSSGYPDAGTTGGADGGSGSSGPQCSADPIGSSGGSNWQGGLDLGIGTEKQTFQKAAAVFCRALRLAGWPSTTEKIAFKLKGSGTQTWSTTSSCESKRESTYAGTFGVELCGPFIEGSGSKKSTSSTQLCKECETAPRYSCTTDGGSGCTTNTEEASIDATAGQNFDLGKSFFEKYSKGPVKLSGLGTISGTVSGSTSATSKAGTDACTGATCPHTESRSLTGSLGFDLAGSLSGYVYGFGATAKAAGGGDFTWTFGWNGDLEQWCLQTAVTSKFHITVTGKVKIKGTTSSATIFKWECTAGLQGDSCVVANNTVEEVECKTTWFVPENELECQPLTCGQLDYKCGSFESCGQTMQCGSCNPGYSCQPEWGNSLGTYCREDYVPPPPSCEDQCHFDCMDLCDSSSCYNECKEDCLSDCGSGSGS